MSKNQASRNVQLSSLANGLMFAGSSRPLATFSYLWGSYHRGFPDKKKDFRWLAIGVRPTGKTGPAPIYTNQSTVTMD
jgi:hypothetical protein